MKTDTWTREETERLLTLRDDLHHSWKDLVRHNFPARTIASLRNKYRREKGLI